LKNRLQKLREGFADKGIDAILISQPENRRYLSGFDGSSGYLLITEQSAVLATDFRYIKQAERQSPDYEIFQIKGAITDWFPQLTAEAKLSRLGVESRHITLSLYLRLSDILNITQSQLRLIPVDGLVESLRVIKEPEEIDLITKAVAITDAAVEYIENIICIGMTEKKIAWEIEKFIREKSGQPVSFDIIVASGPNSALPHTKPSSRAVQSGEPIIIDMGARIGGYASDMGARIGGYASDLSRTICLGTPDQTFNKIYDTVLKAQMAAIAGIEEGMTGDEADKTARAVIEQAGYGEAFGHSLGHGIGLAIHEPPRLGPNSEDKLASGMVFTIEPGIYLSGWGGVRIEDTTIIDDGKVRVMSKAKKLGVVHDNQR